MGNFNLDAIVDICANYSGADYYVEDMIPVAKLANARASFPIPNREHVIMLIDATVFGSAKNGLAIGESGIYWHNDWTTKSNKTFLDWNEFIEAEISQKGRYEIEIGSGNFINMSGSSFKKDILVTLLHEIQDYIIGAIQENEKVSMPTSAAAHPQTPSSEWQIAIAGQQYGPYDLITISSMVKSKQINPDQTFVWKAGMTNWMPLLQQPELAALVTPPPPPAASTVPPPPPPSAPIVSLDIDPLAAALESTEDDVEETGLVEVNTASMDRLMGLSGVNAIGAKRIIQYRMTEGGFTSPEQLGNLLGLKPHQVERIRAQVIFTPINSSKQTSTRMVDY